MKDAKSDKGPGRKEAAPAVREVITTHVNADFDALASMIAASKLYPEAALVFSGSQEKSLRNFFLHSVSYLFNFMKLRQVDLSRVEKLILVDTRQRSRIGKFVEILDRDDLEIHIYDHHPASGEDIRGELEIVRPTGSTTAILTDLIRERGIPLTPDEATVMCLGIHEDTGSFTFASTTRDDYRAAAWLTEQGANHNIIADLMTRELTAQQIWLLHDLTRAATKHVINGVEVVITKVIRDEYIGDFAVLVHKLIEMENLDVVFALAQMEDRVHLVARSRKEEVNVADVALALGGGGHPYAASATIRNQTLVQVEQTLMSLLTKGIQPVKTARDLMTSPAIHILPDDSVGKAAELMTRYDINVLLVVNEAESLLGYITRQVGEKAVFFGLEHVPVRDYMNIEVTTVPPQAPMSEIQELIVRNRLRILPVVEEGRVLGVITRTDLLNILVGEPIVPEFLYHNGNAPSALRKKSLSGLLKERLPAGIVRLLREFGTVGDQLGYEVYLVGGLVRDILLKRDNLDVDIVVEGDGIRFAHAFAEGKEVRVRSHRKFATAVLVFPDGFKVDVATARLEYYESPAAPPVVETSSLKMDLYRRDFTINTLAVKLNPKNFGTLIDFFGGQKDIKEGVIRVLHNLSFVEDPSRVLRAIRFEQRFGFKIGKLTLSLIRNAVKIDCFRELSGKRLFMELKLILKEEDPRKGVERMARLDLLRFVSPHLEESDKLLSLFDEIKKVVAWYQLLYLEEVFRPWKVYWYGFISGLGQDALDELGRRLGFTDPESRRLMDQRKSEELLLTRLFRFNGDNYHLYTLLAPYDTEMLLYVMAKAGNEKVKRLISRYFTRLRDTRVLLTGKDLIAMGYEPGPHFSRIFERLLEARLNNRVRTKAGEKRFVRRNFEPGPGAA